MRKNFLSNGGLKTLASAIGKNSNLVHLSLGCNQFSSEGACHLFRVLETHSGITSIDLANNDCYKSKIKIGAKGAEALCRLLKRNQLITMLNVKDNALSNDAFTHLIEGLKHASNLISLNLSQNDIGVSFNTFS